MLLHLIFLRATKIIKQCKKGTDNLQNFKKNVVRPEQKSRQSKRVE